MDLSTIEGRYEYVRWRESAHRIPEFVPGVQSRLPVSYPLPLTESAVGALVQEAHRLSRLGFEGSTAITLRSDGTFGRLDSTTLWDREWARTDMHEAVNRAFEANDASPGWAVTLLHNHPDVQPGRACEPSAQDLICLGYADHTFTEAGGSLQDFMIVGPPGTVPWSFRETVADSPELQGLPIARQVVRLAKALGVSGEEIQTIAGACKRFAQP